MSDSPLQYATQRERWEAHINRLEQALKESRQQVRELQDKLRLRETEIETLAETTITELDLTDAIHYIARALDLQDTGDMHPIHLSRVCRAAALELRNAVEHGKETQQ